MLDKLAKNIVVFFSTVILLTCTIISMFFIATVKNFDENVMIKLKNLLNKYIKKKMSFS